MIKITNEAICTGCHSCASVCPKGCIEMANDKEGFIYPKINEENCVNCGLCIKHCPTLTPKKNPHTEEDITAYAMHSKNETFRFQSSSGGLFPEIASFILKKGGVVFGAALDDEANVRHIYIEKAPELKKLQGTKYVQSVIGDSYKKAEEFLKSGRIVLFSGTPCQIGGLISYLNKDYDNLYTQDLICHGVPSPMAWKKYKDYLRNSNSSSVSSVCFRDKKNGWRNYFISFDLENGKTLSHPSRNDWYMNAFLRDLCLRPSCYDCKFKNEIRPTDITLADFWGINGVIPEMDDNKGTSLVFVNSKKGEYILEGIKENIAFQKTDAKTAIKYNPSMTCSSIKPNTRDRFMKDLSEKDFEFVIKKHLKLNAFGKLKRIISKKLKK